jgi:hypothetical protein
MHARCLYIQGLSGQYRSPLTETDWSNVVRGIGHTSLKFLFS